MLRMSRYCFAAVVLLCFSTLVAHAQTKSVDREVKVAPGKVVRVAIYADIRPDCTPGQLPSIRLAAAPTHGAVRVKRGTLKATNLKQCLAIEVPAWIAFYRAADNFSGTDSFSLEINLGGGRKRLEHFKVVVSNNASSQRI